MTARWMIYGATGYTGALVAEAAAARGHRPILAGRSAAKLEPLARRLGLEPVVLGLDDADRLARGVSDFDLVYHAAGPFSSTSDAMIKACLAGKTSYLDITGEIVVFENTFRYDDDAKSRGICLMSGVGFDVVPTDCMARYVADRLPGATRLEIAFASLGGVSAGTARSMLEHLPKGSFVRRNGNLERVPPAHDVRRVRFYDVERTVVSIPWGDLATAYRSTGIPNITTYMAQSEGAAKLMRLTAPALGRLLAAKPVRTFAQNLVAARLHGPDERSRKRGRSHVWVRASNERGESREAWLETLEGYEFTVEASLRCIERVLAERPRGAITPSMAFGADCVLEIPQTARYDALP
jgi:short subunit dehydrogenase-like uncharacterized protein